MVTVWLWWYPHAAGRVVGWKGCIDWCKLLGTMPEVHLAWHLGRSRLAPSSRRFGAPGVTLIGLTFFFGNDRIRLAAHEVCEQRFGMIHRPDFIGLNQCSRRD